ncbi:MAG: T9SS type A sorting domain-containing protein [Bacteroidota bacterium]
MGKSIRKTSFFLLLAVGFWGQSMSQEGILTWQFEDLMTDQKPSGANPEFLIDPNGTFHLSYWDRNKDRLAYAYRVAGSANWQLEWVDSTLASGFRSSLYIDDAENVHVAYLINEAGKGFLKYGFRGEKGWQTEKVPISSDLGLYGYDERWPKYTQASLDLVMLPDGSPFITYFDGSTFGDGVVHCSTPAQRYVNFYNQYDLFMGLACKQQDSWQIIDSLNIPHDGRGLCLVEHGDRFGEFNKIWIKPDGSIQVFTNSMHNNELLMFSGSSQEIGNWEVSSIDSVKRFAATGLSTGQDLRETFDHIQYLQQSDTLIHLVYGFSELYGNVSLNSYSQTSPFSRRTFFYVKAHPDSLGMPGYTPNFQEMVARSNPESPNSHDGHYRGLFTLSAKDDNSLFIGHYNYRTSEIVFHSTTSGGQEWKMDTLGTFQTNAPLTSQIWQDSLHVMFYESLGDQVIWASRHLSQPEWNIRPVLPANDYGEILETVLTPDQALHVVFNDALKDQLYAGKFTNREWTFQSIDEAGKEIYTATVLPSSNTEVMLAYFAADSGAVKIGYWKDSSWQCSQVDTNLNVRDIKGVIASDSIFLTYFNLTDQRLYVAKSPRDLPFSWEIQPLERGETEPTGDFLALTSDLQGNLYLTYRDLFLPYLKFAFYDPGVSTQWEIDTVSTPDAYFAGKSDIGVLSDGRTVIVFRDQINNTLILAEQNTQRDWEYTFVPTQEGNLVGIPVKMVIDEKDQILILYSLVSNQNELHIIRRNTQSQWETIGLTNNTAQLGQNYSIEKSNGTLYITGQKTNPANTGLGILFAEDLLPTPILPSIASIPLKIWPNPVQDILSIEGRFPNGKGELEIFDIAGKRLMHKALESHTINPSTLSFSVNFLEKGIYVLSLRMGSEQYIAKFIR